MEGLPPEVELARTAADTSPLRELVALAAWLGAGRELTETGMLAPVDVKAVVVELDLIPAPTPSRAMLRDHKLDGLRSARRLPEFVTLWLLAVDLGLIEVRDGWAAPSTEVGEGLSALRTLQLWAELFARGAEGELREWGGSFLLDWNARLFTEVLEGLRDRPDAGGQSRQAAEAGGVAGSDEAGAALTAAVEGRMTRLCAPGGGLADETPERIAAVRRRLAQSLYLEALWFERLGGVRLADRTPEGMREAFLRELRLHRVAPSYHAPDEDELIDCSMRLTPLGRYGMRWIGSSEREALPLSGTESWDDTSEFLDEADGLLNGFCGTPFLEAVMDWSSLRSVDKAVRDLAESCADPSAAVRRGIATSVVWHLEAPALPHVRALLDSERRAVSGFAARALLAARDLPEAERQELALAHEPWVTIDTLAGVLQGSRANLAEWFEYEASRSSGPVDWSPLLDVARVRRADHPWTLSVLDAVGNLHPEREIAEGMRRTARELRSTGMGVGHWHQR